MAPSFERQPGLRKHTSGTPFGTGVRDRCWQVLRKPPGLVLSTKAEGGAEKSAREREAPSIRDQMSRLRST